MSLLVALVTVWWAVAVWRLGGIREWHHFYIGAALYLAGAFGFAWPLALAAVAVYAFGFVYVREGDGGLRWMVAGLALFLAAGVVGPVASQLVGLVVMADDAYQHARQTSDPAYRSPLHRAYASAYPDLPRWLRL